MQPQEGAVHAGGGQVLKGWTRKCLWQKMPRLEGVPLLSLPFTLANTGPYFSNFPSVPTAFR